MSELVVALIVTVSVLLVIGAAFFLVGYRTAERTWYGRLQQVRFEAARAERELHNLTRNAFAAMVDHVERRRSSP